MLLTSELKKKIESNIWKLTLYYTLNKRGYAAVIGVYLLTLPGTTAKSIGFMWLMGTLTTFVLEVPSGYLSDKLGHKKALVFSRFLVVIATACYVIGSSYAFFVVGLMLSMAGGAFMSGTIAAFKHETVTALGREKEYASITGKMRSIGFLGALPLYIIVPILAAVDYRLGFALVLLLDIISFIISTRLVTPPVTQEHIDEVSHTNFKDVVREAYDLGFMKYLIFGALMGGMFWAVNNFRDVYQAAVAIPVIYYGVLFALSRAIIGSMLYISGHIKKLFTYHSFLFTKIVLMSVVLALLAYSKAPWVIAMAFIISTAIVHGLSEVGSAFRLEIIRGSKFKATMLSMGSLMGAITHGVGVYIMGLVITVTNYPTAYSWLLYIGPAILLVAFGYIIWATRTVKH